MLGLTCFGRLLVKVLTNKLKKVVGKVVSAFQPFGEGKQILDAILIANEAIGPRMKSVEKGVLSWILRRLLIMSPRTS